MSIAEQILDVAGGSDMKTLREYCSRRYTMFVRLKDGRHRFQFHDDSYLDIYPLGEA